MEKQRKYFYLSKFVSPSRGVIPPDYNEIVKGIVMDNIILVILVSSVILLLTDLVMKRRRFRKALPAMQKKSNRSRYIRDRSTLKGNVIYHDFIQGSARS